MNLIEEILTEWSYRVPDGMPKTSNAYHLVILEDILQEKKYPKIFIEKLLQNLRQIKEDDIVKNKESGNTYVVAKHNPKKQNLVKKDASSSEIDSVKKDKDDTSKEKKLKDKLSSNQVNELQKDSLPLSDVPSSLKRKQQLDRKKLIDLAEEMVKSEHREHGAGAFTMSKKQNEDMIKFEKERGKQLAEREKFKKDNNLKEGDPELEQYDIDNPLYVHPDVTLYDVTDEHVDDFINEIMIELCGKPVSCKAFTDFKSKIQCSGGPTRPVPGGNHRCVDEKGAQRFKDMVRLYLRSGGRCVVTGEKLPFSKIQPDHRIPFSSAKELAEAKGISLEEAEDILDNPMKNIDLMHENCNQFKSNDTGDKLLLRLETELNQTDDEKEIKNLKKQKLNRRRVIEYNFHLERIKKGDYSFITEESLNNMTADQRNTVMKAWNYYHPNNKDYKQIIKDKSRKQGISIEEAEKIYLKDLNEYWRRETGKDFDIEESTKHWISRKPQGGGVPGRKKRTRGLQRPKGPEIEVIMETFNKRGTKVLTEEQQKKENEASQKALDEINNELNETQIEIETIKLKQCQEIPDDRKRELCVKRQEAKIKKLGGKVN